MREKVRDRERERESKLVKEIPLSCGSVPGVYKGDEKYKITSKKDLHYAITVPIMAKFRSH